MNKSIDIQLALTYVTQDPQWLSKAFLGGFLISIPVVSFVGLGYQVRVARRVTRGEAGLLPAWVDFDSLFREGWPLGLAQMLISLPLVMLMLIPMFGIFGLVFLPAFTDSTRVYGTVGIVATLVFMLFMTLFFISAVVIGFASPAIIARYIQQGTFASCFNVKEIVQFIRRNGRDYLMAWLAMAIGFLAVGAMASVTMIIPCLGVLLYLIVIYPGIFWALMVQGHAIGQVVALDHARLAGPVPALLLTSQEA